MKKHRQYIKRYFSAFMLFAFAIALTPWSVLHHHQEIPVSKKEINCHHVSHVQAQGDTCLICKASFEKNFVQIHHIYRIFLAAKIFNPKQPLLKSNYVNLLRTSLRGPPAA
ncbi:hypothetical protein [Pedobacter sandarakinus]|uniref:hypothetical protein n=1 Tax=Pedobacter sandarakinus TaxID=353156 RepID=UPI0022452297|nr:hypothetical protein [Pedobacter sandarakinus]MCX2573475.1 hypothetical protein [Pedobacter sandarakinus]